MWKKEEEEESNENVWLPEKQTENHESQTPQFRIPKSIHPYSSGMASMYLAQKLASKTAESGTPGEAFEFGGPFQLTVTLSVGSFLLLPTSRPVSTKGLHRVISSRNHGP